MVYIPAGFSEALIPDADSQEADFGEASVEVYTDPAATVSPVIIQSIVEQISAGLNTLLLARQVSADQVVEYAQMLGPQMAELAGVLQSELSDDELEMSGGRLELDKVQVGEEQEPFNIFATWLSHKAALEEDHGDHIGHQPDASQHQ